LYILELFDTRFDKLMFNDIDLKYINDFDEYLRIERDVSNNTIKYYIKTFRALINKAIKDGDASLITYPFGKNGYSISALEQETEKRYLPNEYIEKLKTAELESYTMQWVRNLFLFSYYCQGMSFIDVALLTKYNILVFEGGKYIAYRRQKTESKDAKIIRIKITDKIQQLLNWFSLNTQLVEDYLTPCITIEGYKGEQLYNHIRDRYRRYNKHLKTLGRELKFEGIQLSSYMSRHSYAMRLKNSGIPEDVISEALGHKDLSTTKVYLDSFQKDEIAKANEVL
jgi:integrase